MYGSVSCLRTWFNPREIGKRRRDQRVMLGVVGWLMLMVDVCVCCHVLLPLLAMLAARISRCFPRDLVYNAIRGWSPQKQFVKALGAVRWAMSFCTIHTFTVEMFLKRIDFEIS